MPVLSTGVSYENKGNVPQKRDDHLINNNINSN